jgi:hypothetical protein
VCSGETIPEMKKYGNYNHHNRIRKEIATPLIKMLWDRTLRKPMKK